MNDKLLRKEYNPFFENYVSLALNTNNDIIKNMYLSFDRFYLLLSNLPEDKHLYAYDDKKWTVKELISHIIDTERILTYRALCISRNHNGRLQPFDENEFVENSNANEIPFNELINEFTLLRKATIAMFNSFNAELLIRKGILNNVDTSVRALGYIISGHVLHHLNILEERYL